MTWPLWKPGSVAVSRTKLRISSAPAASSTTAQANWAVTRAAKIRRCRRLDVAPRPPSFSATADSGPRRFDRGQQAADERRRKGHGRREGEHARVERDLLRARQPVAERRQEEALEPPRQREAAAPPATASTPVSISIRRITRARPAPSAVRIAISRVATRSAREHEARDVGAGDQQEHADRRQEHHEHAPDVADDFLAHR